MILYRLLFYEICTLYFPDTHRQRSTVIIIVCFWNLPYFRVYSDEKTLADLYNERGFTKYLYVDFNGAVDDYTKAIEYNSNSHIYYYNRALVHYRLGQYV